MRRVLGQVIVAVALSLGVYQVGVAQGMSQQEIEVLASKAMAGDVEAQFNLGRMYDNGRGVRQDAAQAVAWYEKAAAQGHADAQAYLGVIYLSGRGVRQDYAKAYEWLVQAATRRNADAQVSLGHMYLQGLGVRQDFVKAKEWYGRACDNGTQPACDLYRQLNERGH